MSWQSRSNRSYPRLRLQSYRRLCGGSDIDTASGKGPEASTNFITCHDGFTLHGLVTYRDKHNEANGENNHDGTNANYSDNYCVEGETDDPAINAVQTRQIKNMLLTLFVSRGVPMLLGGDEFGRTQGGNNNAYCQDNATSWYDWRRLVEHSEVFSFAKTMITFRREHPILSAEHFYNDDECHWSAPQGGSPAWLAPQTKQFGWLVHEDGSHAIYLMFNAGNEAVDFVLPHLTESNQWQVISDTAGEPSRQAVVGFRQQPKSPAIAVTISDK